MTEHAEPGKKTAEKGTSGRRKSGYGNRRKKKGNPLPDWRILAGAGIVAALLLGAGIYAIVSGNKAQTANAEERQTESFSMEERSEEPQTASEPVTETPQTQETLPQAAADIAPMEDAEDPQNIGNALEAGSAVNVTDQPAAAQGETGTVTHGIDVAKYQGVIDWKQVKAAGMDFAMIRAGYRTSTTGVLCEDPQARYNLQEAQAAGLKVGVYFFSTAVTPQEAREEASWLTGFIAPYRITYPVVYNCENFTSPDSRQSGLDKEQRSRNAVVFLEAVRAAGYTPMFYANKSEMEASRDWDMSQLSGYKIWTAYYPTPTYPDPGSSGYSGESMWQYTNQGSVPGVGGRVDLNVAYFGYEQEAQAKDSTPPETVAANVEALIRFEEVNETVTAKIETNLRSVPSSVSPDTIVAKIVNGDQVTRTGIGSNGWSRLDYNGQTVYAITSYLTAAQ